MAGFGSGFEPGGGGGNGQQAFYQFGLNQTVPAGAQYYSDFFVSGLSASLSGHSLFPPSSINFISLVVRTNSIQPASGNLVIGLWVNGVLSSLQLTVPANGAVNAYVATGAVLVPNTSYIFMGYKNNAGAASAQIGGYSITGAWT